MPKVSLPLIDMQVLACSAPGPITIYGIQQCYGNPRHKNVSMALDRLLKAGFIELVKPTEKLSKAEFAILATEKGKLLYELLKDYMGYEF